MRPVYFFTGFPGFIANQLIIGMLDKNFDFEKIYLLVLSSMKTKAEEQIQQWSRKYNLPIERFEIIEGDITLKSLGIQKSINEVIQNKVTHVFHLAAIYDLAVPKSIAEKVNVQGTTYVNEWVKGIKNIRRYVYFSTAYVAGTRTGILKETELIEPKAFKNHYEETKFKAEVLVEELKAEVPVTIIRPGIVKGHSKTGETVKFDGPYLFLNMLDRLRKVPVFPQIGHKEAVINLVPIDYVVDATLYLSHAEVGEGKTYHLTDPNPYPVTDVYAMMLEELLGKKPKGRLPLSLVHLFLSYSSIRKKLGIEKETLEYLTWRGKFDASLAQKDLEGSGLVCPDLRDQIPAMIQFYLQNKDNKDYHIQIR